jgi:hypothetical protein
MNKTYKIIDYIYIFIIIYIIFRIYMMIKKSHIIVNYENFDNSQLFINYIESNLTKNTKNLIIITHTELGDIYIMNGAIRYYSTIYDKIIYICRQTYYDQMSLMYNDNKNILIYPINSDNLYSDIDKFITIDDSMIHIFNIYNIDFIPMYFFKNKYKPYILSNIDIMHNINPINNYPIFMYDELKLDPEIRYTNFKINRDLDKENDLYNKLISILGEKYIIIIDDKVRNYIVDIKYIKNKELPLFYLGNNSSNTDSRLNEIQDKYISNYIKILEKATEVHTIESSIYVLLDELNITNNIYVHAYTRNGNVNNTVNCITKNKSFKFIYIN